MRKMSGLEQPLDRVVEFDPAIDVILDDGRITPPKPLSKLSRRVPAIT